MTTKPQLTSVSPLKRKLIVGSAIVGLLTVGLAAWAQDSSPSTASKTTNTADPPTTAAPSPQVPAVAAPTSFSQTSKVEIVPASVELQPKGPATALLIMRNPGSSTLSDIKVTPVTDAALNVSGKPSFAEPQRIVSKGEFAWAVEISNKGEDPVDGSVIFRIEHVLGTDSTTGVPQVTYAVLQVKGRDVTDVAEVKMETALESLDQQHPGNVYLVITNKSNQSITLKRNEITWDKPDFIKIPAKASGTDAGQTAKEENEPLVLAPHQTAVIGFNVGTADKVQPGKHLLVARVPFGWGGAERAQQRSIVVTKEIQVGVLGESALLKLFAIPSFLIIPGFIGVIIWGVLWKWGLFKTKQDTGDFPLQFSEQPTNPQFWVAAITISIPVILVYRLLINRDVLGFYGLSDLVAIWLASVIVLGLGGYFAIIGGRRWYLRRRTPSESDTPIRILEKLSRQGLDVFREQVRFDITENGAAKTYQALLFQKRDPNRPTSWVGPPIQVVWKGAKQKLKDAVDNQRKPGSDPGELARTLQGGGRAVELKWKDPAEDSLYVSEPTEVKTPGLTFLSTDSVVEII